MRSLSIEKISGLIFLTIITLSLISNSFSVKAYSDIIDETNHAYPIYHSLILKLNNATNEGLQAQIKIYNQTTCKWEINYPLLEHVQNVLNNLTNIIDGLKELTIYDYNSSFLPGCLYLLLSPETFNLAGAVANNTIEYVIDNPAVFWFVDNLSYDTLDLGFDEFKPLDSIGVNSILIVTAPWPPDGYYIENNTLIIRYRERDNITASLFNYNGGHWSYNYEFIQHYNETMAFLNSLYFFSSSHVSLKPMNMEVLNLRVQNLNKDNITFTVPDNATQETFYRIYGDTSEFDVDIEYNANLTYADKLKQFLVVFTIISHLWFTAGHWLAHTHNYTDSTFSPAFISVITFLIIAFAISTKRKRKHKLS